MTDDSARLRQLVTGAKEIIVSGMVGGDAVVKLVAALNAARKCM
jgi:hypothetical protein